MEKKKVVVGLSGGVDSSVAAWLLKEQGYEVIGVTMLAWQENSKKVQGGEEGHDLLALDDARQVAAQLEIPYSVLDFRKEFKAKVMDYFAREYCQGRTPNPCIACNRYVKWESLMQYAREVGADYIATGHYAQIRQLPNGRYAVANSVTGKKDQTYALYSLTQKQLSSTLMPIGAYTKSEIRQMAEKIGLRVAGKPDSQEICFISDGNYVDFLKREYGAQDSIGNFVDRSGHVLGQHRGIIHYTIGQRKGLGISFGKPMFVEEIRPDTKEVVLTEEADLYTNIVYAAHLNFMGMENLYPPEKDFSGKKVPGYRLVGKVRYNHQGAVCLAEQIKEDLLCCTFEEPQRAITPGQALVLYDEAGHVAAGGTIIYSPSAVE